MRQDNRTSIGVKTGLALLAVTLMMTGTRAFAQHETILRWFTDVPYGDPNDAPDGIDPTGTLTFDAAGNLYGTTLEGGAYGEGAVFELFPKPGGGWREQDKILHSFNTVSYTHLDVYKRQIFDTAGNLYGAAGQGGANHGGAVFKLVPTGDGSWSYNALYNFGESRDGTVPNGNLIFDAAGNLYGVTSMGGTHDYGMAVSYTHLDVYKRQLVALVDGVWVIRCLPQPAI